MFWKDWHVCLPHFLRFGVRRLTHYLHDRHCLAQPLRSACRPAPALAWKGHSQAQPLEDPGAGPARGRLARSRGGAAGFPGYLESPACSPSGVTRLVAGGGLRGAIGSRVLLLRHLWRRRTFANCYAGSLLQFIESINDDDLARVYVLDRAGIAVSSHNRDVPNTDRLVRIDYIDKSSGIVALNRRRWNEGDGAERVYQ